MSLLETVVTMGIFFLMAGIGVGAYFNYYKTSLINDDINNAIILMKETRFSALKNRGNFKYGVHIDEVGGTLTGFRGDTFDSEDSLNRELVLKNVEITNIDLQPTPGTTRDIIFSAKTGKTENTGSFMVGDYTITISAQGTID